MDYDVFIVFVSFDFLFTWDFNHCRKKKNQNFCGLECDTYGNHNVFVWLFSLYKKMSLKRAIIKIFVWTDDLRERLLNIEEKARSYFLIIGIICTFPAICLVINQYELYGMLMFVMAFSLIFVSSAQKILQHVTGFLGEGMLYWILIMMVIIFIIWLGFGEASFWFIYFAMLAMWCFYSLIADVNVAQTANQIISFFFAFLAVLKDIFLAYIPIRYLEVVVSSDGETVERIIEKCFGMAVNPILAINIITLLLVSLKAYWMEKERNRKDNETK